VVNVAFFQSKTLFLSVIRAFQKSFTV